MEEKNISPFGFAIEGRGRGSRSAERLEDFVKAQILGLLDIVVLTNKGKIVEVDGFVWMKDAFGRVEDGAPKSIPLNDDDGSGQ
ncbi:hypothetical protein ACQKGC_28300 [Allorhizobium pseudoryzae]|uniref:hypothetical protein n=1 Tax=Allorhizobium pseudoryzae TaxID=379684 RepID=UPI003D076680